MAIFAFKTYCEKKNLSEIFFSENIVGTGHIAEDYIAGHTMIESMKTGDIVYLSIAKPGYDITVSGIGIITNNKIEREHLPIARNVKWFFLGEFKIDAPDDGNSHTRISTVTEEFSPDVQLKIIEHITIVDER